MAELNQTPNGKWKLVDIKHDDNAPSDVTIPATFIWHNKEVHMSITTVPQSAATEWVTELGTPILLKDITAKFKDVTRKEDDGWKTYRAVSAFTDNDIKPFVETLEVSCSNTEPSSDGGSATLSITSNTSWVVTVEYSGSSTGWVHVPVTAGTGDYTGQTITFDPNTGTTDRFATIIVACGSLEKRIQIKQSGFVPTISVTAPSVAATATSISYTVSSNVDAVTVKCSNGQSATTKTGRFTIPANTGTTEKTYSITAYCTNYPSYSATTTVTQSAAGVELSATCSNTRPGNQQTTATLTVSSNVNWTISSDSSWITVSTPLTGTGNGTRTVTFDANPTTSERTGHITVVGGGITREITITQADAGAYLTATCDDVSAPSEQIKTTLRITSNVAWTASSDSFWIKVASPTGTGDATREVTIEVNISIVQRNGKITVSGDGVAPVEINITQEPGDIPLTFVVTGPGIIMWSRGPQPGSQSGGIDDREIRYSKNGGVTWTTISTENTGSTVSVSTGDRVLFVGDNPGFSGCTFCGTTCTFELEGNIISLINSTDFTTARTLTSQNTFAYLFTQCTGLTSAENLILPATGLTNYCYTYMFAHCDSLTKPAVLKATIMKPYCYYRMFLDCDALLDSPVLPATTLANNCYAMMFEKCYSLTGAPSLPAMTMVDGCYYYMFWDCSALTTAPELRATTLAKECYRNMFYNCKSLNYIKCLATDISAQDCTKGWVYNVARTGTFVRDENMNDWEINSDDGIPVGWTIVPPITPPAPTYDHKVSMSCGVNVDPSSLPDIKILYFGVGTGTTEDTIVSHGSIEVSSTNEDTTIFEYEFDGDNKELYFFYKADAEGVARMGVGAEQSFTIWLTGQPNAQGTTPLNFKTYWQTTRYPMTGVPHTDQTTYWDAANTPSMYVVFQQ